MPRNAALISIFARFAACLALMGCHSAQKPPSTMAEALHPGAKFEKNSDDFFITDTLPKQTSDDEYVSEAAVDVKRIAQALQAGARDVPSGITTVSFLFLRPDMDRLGNAGAHSFFSATYAVGDLKTAHVEKIGAYGSLDLAKEVQIVLPWNIAVGEWCTEHDRAPSFCWAARASVGPEFQWPIK